VHAIIGLGNPGSEYVGTRHNIGFAAVDEVAHGLRVEFRAGRGEYFYAEKVIRGERVVLVKPATYMNNSGIAVRQIVDRYELPLDRVLVIADDFHLPLGVLRLRLCGSDGGHNGLASIIYQLESDSFPRLRCGIGSPAMPRGKKGATEFVLSPFECQEEESVRMMVKRSSQAVSMVILEGLQAAMNECNITNI